MSTWIWPGIGLVWLAAMLLMVRRNDERWKDVGAGGVLAFFVVGFFWRTIVGDVFQPADGGDLVSFLYPTYRFAAHTLAAGQLPLWNPTLYGGAPFISDIQAGFLYPPNLILFLLYPEFPYTWMQWLAIGHLWWAGLGVYVLVRVLGFSRPAALLAGTAFAFSDPLLIHLGNLNLIAVLSWIGWVLAAYQLALSRRSLRWAALTALLFAIANYAGHAQSSYYVGLAVGIYTIFWVVAAYWMNKERRMKNGWSKRQSLFLNLHSFGILAVTAVLTFLLTAPILLPSVELVEYTARADFAYQETVTFSLAPAPGIMGLLTPGFFGRGPALHWSLWDRVELPYAGVPTLLLAIGALLLAGDRRQWRRLLPWIGLALFGFVVALGIYTPVHGWLTQILPGFGQFRAPARAIVLFTLALSILAAAGLDSILSYRKGAKDAEREGADDRQQTADGGQQTADGGQQTADGGQQTADGGQQTADGGRRTADSRPRNTQHATRNSQFTIHNSQFTSLLRWGGLVLLVFVTPLIYASLLFFQEDSTAFLRASLAGLAVALATLAWLGTWLLVALFLRGTLTARWFAGLLIALVLLELSSTGSYTDIAESNPAAGFHHPEIVAFLRAQADDGAQAAEHTARNSQFAIQNSPYPFRIDTRTGIDDLWQPDTAALYGLEDVGGIVNPLALRHWVEFWESTGGRQTLLYDMLNVRYVVVRDETPLPEKFVLAFDAPGPLAVYENPDAFLRAWVVEDAIHVNDPLAVLQSPDFDPARTVILAEERPQTADSRRQTADGGQQTADGRPRNTQFPIRNFEFAQSPNEMSISVTAPAPAYLVLSEIWYPGWRATVNGADVPVLRANHALRAVALPAGELTVRLWFAPESWRWGLGLIAAGLIGSVVLLVAGNRRSE
jgi:hypothetical protein